jgi:ATP-dependent RNA circularization protein (DNA/RNA ligase family)
MQKNKIYIKTVELDDYEFIKRFNEIIKKLNLEKKIKVDEDGVQITLGEWNPEETDEIIATLSDYVKHGKSSH